MVNHGVGPCLADSMCLLSLLSALPEAVRQRPDSSSHRPTPMGNATLWVVAVGAAHCMVMLLALVVPWFSGSGAGSWAVALLGGLGTGLIALGVACIKRGSGERRSSNQGG